LVDGFAVFLLCGSVCRFDASIRTKKNAVLCLFLFLCLMLWWLVLCLCLAENAGTPDILRLSVQENRGQTQE